jgi:hypothetical protein
MTELIYDEIKVFNLIKEKYPDAIYEDATDMVHTDRFSVKIESIDSIENDEWIEFCLKEGFLLNCLGAQLKLRDKDFKEYQDKVMNIFNRLKKDGCFEN